MLFDGCGTSPPRVAVLNMDDEYGRELIAKSQKNGSKVSTYGLNAGDFHAEDVEITSRGTRFQLVTPSGEVPLFSPMIGQVNVYNILAAAAAAQARDCSLEAIAQGMRRSPGYPDDLNASIADSRSL